MLLRGFTANFAGTERRVAGLACRMSATSPCSPRLGQPRLSLPTALSIRPLSSSHRHGAPPPWLTSRAPLPLPFLLRPSPMQLPFASTLAAPCSTALSRPHPPPWLAAAAPLRRAAAMRAYRRSRLPRPGHHGLLLTEPGPGTGADGHFQAGMVQPSSSTPSAPPLLASGRR